MAQRSSLNLCFLLARSSVLSKCEARMPSCWAVGGRVARVVIEHGRGVGLVPDTPQRREHIRTGHATRRVKLVLDGQIRTGNRRSWRSAGLKS